MILRNTVISLLLDVITTTDIHNYYCEIDQWVAANCSEEKNLCCWKTMLLANMNIPFIKKFMDWHVFWAFNETFISIVSSLYHKKTHIIWVRLSDVLPWVTDDPFVALNIRCYFLHKLQAVLFLCISRYIPEISETSLKGLDNLFAPNAERKSLFLGKKFIFLSSKQVCYFSLFEDIF